MPMPKFYAGSASRADMMSLLGLIPCQVSQTSLCVYKYLFAAL